MKNTPITVLYDGKCGLCSKEIQYYKKIASQTDFIWADIANTPSHLDGLDISLTEGLKILHTIDVHGNQHKGVDAFILIWSQLDYWRWLARFTSLPGIRQLANGLYHLIATWRFKRLAHCQMSLEDNTK